MTPNPTPSLAAGNELERCLYFCIKAAQAHYSGKSPVLSPGDAKWVATIPSLIAAQNNATYEAVMEAIGEDGVASVTERCGFTQHQNQLRAELRQSIAKIFGKEGDL